MIHLIELTPNEYEGLQHEIWVPNKSTYSQGDKLIVSMAGYRIQKEYIIDEVSTRTLGVVSLHISPYPPAPRLTVYDDLPGSVGGGFNDGEGEE